MRERSECIGCLTRTLVARLRAIGAPPAVPIAFVAAASAVHATGAASSLANGADLPFRITRVPVTLPLPELVARLDAVSAPLLYGYPTMLAQLAAEKRAGRLKLAPRMVTATSETLTPQLRAAITEAFGAPIVDTFGSTEGLVGVTAPDSAIHTLNSDGCIVELVDRDNRPVADGEPCDRVLVTNLTNLVQPLIRYELNDQFVRQPAADGHARVTIQGRDDEVLRFGATAIHPHVLRSVLVGVPAVLDYQIRQTRTGVAIDAIARTLARALATAGLAGAEVTLHPVPALERDARTGKLCRVVALRD